MQKSSPRIPGWIPPLLWAVGLGGFCLLCMQSCAKYLLCDCNRYITVYNVLFSLLAGIFAGNISKKAPALLGGFCAGLFGGFLYMANAFEKSTLGSYGLIGLFLFLASGLALGGIGEWILSRVRKKKADARRDAFLTRLLYRK